MSTLNQQNILITGGASGIGKIMGRIALEKGARNLVIWDIDQEAMNRTAKEFAHLGQVTTQKVDVSQLDEIKIACLELEKENLQINILINNAGIIVGGNFWQNSHEKIQKTMAINTAALMHLTREILPGMMDRKQGHIVNISSAASLVANPKMSVYAASKWAVTAWSESLRLELEAVGSPVNVTTVTPSYISTGMFEGVKTHWIQPILEPEKTAQKIIKAVEKNKIIIRMPWSVYMTPFLKGILPVRWFDLVVGKWLKVYKSMDEFRGKKIL